MQISFYFAIAGGLRQIFKSNCHDQECSSTHEANKTIESETAASELNSSPPLRVQMTQTLKISQNEIAEQD
jgi:hypothetical protein